MVLNVVKILGKRVVTLGWQLNVKRMGRTQPLGLILGILHLIRLYTWTKA